MDYLSRIRIFVEVARRESFIGAAGELGITASAVSKQVKNLENDLKVKLFNRTTRNVALTEEGALFYEKTRRAFDDIAEAKEELNELKATPRGSIKISVPTSLGQKHLKRPLAEFAALYPEVILDIVFDDRMINLNEEGFDLAIRIDGQLENSSLIARKLINVPMSVCASPEYIKKNNCPKIPSELVEHSVVAYTRHKGAHEWRYRQNTTGEVGVVPLYSRLKADNADMMIEASLQGLGLVIMPTFYLQQYLLNGQLVEIMKDYTTWPQRNLYAIYKPSRYISTRLRLLIEHIDQYCQRML